MVAEHDSKVEAAIRKSYFIWSLAKLLVDDGFIGAFRDIPRFPVEPIRKPFNQGSDFLCTREAPD